MAFDDEWTNSLRGFALVNRSLPNARRAGSRDGFISVAAVLLLLMAAAIVFAAIERWRVATILGALAAFLFVLIGNGPVVRWLAGALQGAAFFETPRDLSGLTAIVLLGDGSIVVPSGGTLPRWLAFSRIECAVRLYQSVVAGGWRAHVIVTGDDTAAEKGRPAMYADRLRALGVHAEHMKVEGQGRNTYRQAELTTEMLRAERYDRVLLVTSGLHMKRALQYFAHFGVRAIPVASDFVKVSITPLPRGENFAIAEIALHQYVGIARLRIYNAFGLNKASAPGRHSAVGTNS